MQHVDNPRRRPHDAQGARGVWPGAVVRRREYDVAWAEPGDSWWVDRKVSMRRIHGPRCTHLTQLRAPARSEEGR
jgi:hypothetical protein